MFHDIPAAVIERMRFLEALDQEQRRSEVPRKKRLCQVPPETGRFLALLAAAAPPGALVEVGTSGGYSGLWLALACRATGRRLRTYEALEEKAALARETFEVAGVLPLVEAVLGDARAHLERERDVAFLFLDGEKEEYADCFARAAPNLVPGGIVVADNVHSHRAILDPFVDGVLADASFDATVVPIGKGLLVARRP